MIKLENKKILMFYPHGATKHLGDAIIKELESRGAFVCGYDERPSQNTLVKIIIRLFKKKVPQFFDKYINRIINLNHSVDFDYILICRGEAFTPSTINNFRKVFPKAKIILYLWDILKCADVREIIPYCDSSFSFDPYDVQENKGLKFRPLFYTNEYIDNDITCNFIYDLMFIGTLHTNRHKVIEKIYKLCLEQNLKLFSYLYIPSILVYFKDFILKFPYIDITKVNFKPLSMNDSIDILRKSRAILDINYAGQKSLSSRACEAMVARRKYITTNSEIKKYDFYHPNNIAIIDIDNPIIPQDFLELPFIPVSDSILNKYSISGLIEDLFSNSIL